MGQGKELLDVIGESTAGVPLEMQRINHPLDTLSPHSFTIQGECVSMAAIVIHNNPGRDHPSGEQGLENGTGRLRCRHHQKANAAPAIQAVNPEQPRGQVTTLVLLFVASSGAGGCLRNHICRIPGRQQDQQELE